MVQRILTFENDVRLVLLYLYTCAAQEFEIPFEIEDFNSPSLTSEFMKLIILIFEVQF